MAEVSGGESVSTAGPELRRAASETSIGLVLETLGNEMKLVVATIPAVDGVGFG